MKLKKSLIAATLAMACVFPSQAGIPVSVILDATAQVNQIQNFAQMLKEYAMLVDQLTEMRRQLSQMEKEYDSVTGSRNLGEILNDPEFKQYLPDNWKGVYQNIRHQGYDGLSGTARAMRDASKIFDACEYLTDPTEKRICNAQAVKPSQDQAFAQDAYQTSTNRVTQIESLMSKINQTSDPKAIAELNARIQAEQAMIQNEQTKIALYQASADAEERILAQQQEEYTAKRIASRNYGNKVPPMEF